MKPIDRPPAYTPPGQPGWLITFSDLLSLLLAFFVMLFASLVMDVQKFDDIKGSLKEAFRTTTRLDRPRALDESVPEEITLAPADNLDYIHSVLRQRLQSDPLLAPTRLTRNTRDKTLNIMMPSQLLFSPASAALTPAGQEAVTHLADLLANLDNAVEVAGHTDATPIHTADFASNWELSLARAQAVADLLRTKGVVSLTASGYAEGRLHEVNPGLPPAERAAQARRVEIVLHGNR